MNVHPLLVTLICILVLSGCNTPASETAPAATGTQADAQAFLDDYTATYQDRRPKPSGSPTPTSSKATR